MDCCKVNVPAVSVIMPAYNCERYIEKAVRSVLTQSFKDFELIVLDDGSSDNTKEIVRCLAKEDGRIVFLENECNMGVAATRNRGLDISRGKYIALLDSDDIWCETKLERQIAKLESERADICYCSYAIIDADGEKIKRDYKVPETVGLNRMLRENYIGCSTVVISREALGNYRFLTDFYHEDYVLWLELLQNGAKAVGCRETLAQWRLIKNSRSFNKKRSAAHRWRIYTDYLHFSRLKSAWLFVFYTLNGIKKYFCP